jgi:hypothetical protein
MGRLSGVNADLITKISGIPVANISKVGPISSPTIGLNTVYFAKGDYDIGVSDPISSFVRLTRGNNQALYNLNAGESSYQYPNSPLNTEWNADGGDLSNYASRTYTNFADALQYNVGLYILVNPLIMHDINDGKYYSMTFTSWTQNNNGGGFEYTRTLLNPGIINTSAKVFTRGSFPSSADACIYGAASIPIKGSQIVYYNSGDNTIYTDAEFTTPFLGYGNYWWDTNNKWWWVNNEGGVIDSHGCG